MRLIQCRQGHQSLGYLASNFYDAELAITFYIPICVMARNKCRTSGGKREKIESSDLHCCDLVCAKDNNWKSEDKLLKYSWKQWRQHKGILYRMRLCCNGVLVGTICLFLLMFRLHRSSLRLRFLDLTSPNRHATILITSSAGGC